MEAAATAPHAAGETAYGLIGDKIYVAGGISESPSAGPAIVTATQVYDTTTNTWSTDGAPNPYNLAGTGVALDGKLYDIGGLSLSTFQLTPDVSVYDPATNAWTQAAPYPLALNYAQCGAIDGKIYCTGGAGQQESDESFVYNPASNSWSRFASVPGFQNASAFGVANGELILSGGTTGVDATDLTNGVLAYNPERNWWVPLPSLPAPEYFGQAAQGFYEISGTQDDGPVTAASVLSGYDSASPVKLPWLSTNTTTVTLRPHQSVTITVRLNAKAADLSRPSTLIASLGFETDTPYSPAAIPVSLTVLPARTGGNAD
ncbi:MAG: kelch repeat-containing protein [Solirubrobacteraceae bacterium]